MSSFSNPPPSPERLWVTWIASVAAVPLLVLVMSRVLSTTDSMLAGSIFIGAPVALFACAGWIWSSIHLAQYLVRERGDFHPAAKVGLVIVLLLGGISIFGAIIIVGCAVRYQ